jgi:hypothetical protein
MRDRRCQTCGHVEEFHTHYTGSTRCVDVQGSGAARRPCDCEAFTVLTMAHWIGMLLILVIVGLLGLLSFVVAHYL